jgi:stage II sporulation protein D
VLGQRLLAAVVAAAVLLSACTGAEPAGSDERPPRTASETGVEASSPSSAEPSATPRGGPPVEIALGDAGTFRLRGEYPEITSTCKGFEQPTFDARYPGDLLVERGKGRTLRVIVTVPFDEYLKGIAEVPPTWPAEALEAQAIAARSYALARIGFTGPEGAPVQTPICATTACQVYNGIPLERTPGIKRWYAAVRRTDGQVLVHRRRPADTVYFSTSNGHTYGNEDVFGSEPLPYLRPIVERDDGASPTSRWRVPLPYDDLSTFLSARGLWGGGRITRVDRLGSVVEIRGGGGTETVDEGSFREAVNGAAPCLYPGRYPTNSRLGTELPLTIPSGWYSTEPGRRSVDVVGRGWGHGVGMVQWGAYGKARKGWSAARILATYYGGLRPRTYPEPGAIPVLVAEGITSLIVRPDGPGATVRGEPLDEGRVALSPAKGGVRVRIRSATQD